MKYLKLTGKVNNLSVSLKAFVKTRWNTVCDMFETFIAAYEDIRALLNGRNDLIARYNKINIDTVKEVKEFLELFKKISDELQSDKVVTAVKILPAFEMLITHIQIKPNDSTLIKKMKNRASIYINANKDDVLPSNFKLWAFFNPDCKRLQQFKTIDKTSVMEELELSISIMENQNAIGNQFEENIVSLSSRSDNTCEKSLFNELHDSDEPMGNLSEQRTRMTPQHVNQLVFLHKNSQN